MAFTTAQFRLDFPEFASVTEYPDTMLTFWSGVAAKMLNESKFGNLFDAAVELYTAHRVVLQKRSMKDAAAGNIPGQNKGPISSKSVDKVSISYDSGAATNAMAGHLNLTSYGIQLWELIEIFGAGPLHVGVDATDTLPTDSMYAFGGPWYVNPNPNG